MTEESQINEFHKFEETVDLLSDVLEDHRAELKRAKNVAKTGVVVGILGIIVALIGGAVGLDGRSLAQNIQTARKESRIAGCIQANVATQGNRGALVSSILTFAKDPTHLTPQEQAVLDVYTARVEQALPYRDCSPEGIDRYYENPPIDPAK